MTQERITSRQNPLLVHIKKLQSSRSYRTQHGQFVGDGTKLLTEAVRWCRELETVIAADGAEIGPLPPQVRLVRVPEDVLESISQMQSPQGALFVCRMPPLDAAAISPGTLILDGIQDPGNLGTILRTADALEVPVVLTEGCVDPYNPKVVRATMGALFRTPPRQTTRQAVADLCHECGVKLVATALSERAVDIRTCLLDCAAVIIGSEGSGVSQEFLDLTDEQVIIPMSEHCESLNAAIAAAIVMWQMKR